MQAINFSFDIIKQNQLQKESINFWCIRLLTWKVEISLFLGKFKCMWIIMTKKSISTQYTHEILNYKNGLIKLDLYDPCVLWVMTYYFFIMHQNLNKQFS